MFIFLWTILRTEKHLLRTYYVRDSTCILTFWLNIFYLQYLKILRGKNDNSYHRWAKVLVTNSRPLFMFTELSRSSKQMYSLNAILLNSTFLLFWITLSAQHQEKYIIHLQWRSPSQETTRKRKCRCTCSKSKIAKIITVLKLSQLWDQQLG